MVWERALGGAFVRLRFRNEMAAGSGRPAEVFEGHGYYRMAPGGLDGTGAWFDSRGAVFPVRVTLGDDRLTSDWGGAGGEQGRTVYRLAAADTLEVIDAVRGAGGDLREFGRSRLSRVGATRTAGDARTRRSSAAR
jgi:hypothetical protein